MVRGPVVKLRKDGAGVGIGTAAEIVLSLPVPDGITRAEGKSTRGREEGGDGT